MSTTADSSSSASNAPVHNRGRLLRVLGVWFGISAAIGNAIAAGIVYTPGQIGQSLPNPWYFIGVWIIGGFYALVGAPSMAELGALIPRSGGQYNFSRRALGEYPGFIVGWSDWLSTCGTAASVSLVISEYASYFFPVFAGENRMRALSVAIIAGFGLLQWSGIQWGKSAQLYSAGLKTAAFLLLVIACLIRGGAAHAQAVQTNLSSSLALPSGWPLAVALLLSLQAVIYTIDGWDGVIYFGGEVSNPGRDVPRAIFGSVFSVMGIYLLLNLVSLYILPMKEIAGNTFVLGTVANRIFGSLGDPIIRSIMIVSMLSCLNANQLFCTRTLYIMSTDRLFFRPFTRVNSGGTPTLSLLLSTIVGILFVLGTFKRVIAMLSFFFVANYTLSYLSHFVLRFREPDVERPYKAWGYPFTTGLALFGSVAFLIGSIATDRENVPLALGLLVLSYPVFLALRWASNRPTKPVGGTA
ncbi:MAG: APC family permease [Acidobacteria bacterium]|nr:APC family permease [Acidobacteriota bacterium]MBS1865416.1 APC family permease [Acidobacteriota bacterium]